MSSRQAPDPAALPVTRPVPLGEWPAPAPARAGMQGLPGVPLGLAGALLGLGALLLGAAVAFALSTWLPLAPWAAAAGAVAGLLAAGAPAAWMLWRLARDLAPADGRGDAGPEPVAGVSRELFMNLAEREFARARRYGTGAALLLVELDRFARLHENRGAAAVEAVLAELLRQTGPTLRTADVLTSFTASQMAVFLAHADATGALDVAERIRERTEQMEVTVPGTPQRLRVTVSAGVAHLRPAHLSLAALIDDTQDAVAVARQAGGNCVRAAPVDAAAGGGLASWRERRARPRPNGKL